MAHKERCHNNSRVECVTQDEVEVERRLVVSGAAHGLHVEGEDATFDPGHLVVLHEQDATLAVGVRHEVAFVLEVFQASWALLDGVEVMVEHDSFQDESLLSRLGGLLEALSITRVPKLRVDVDTVGLVVGPHAVRRCSVCCTRNAELYRMIVVTVEGFLQMPDNRICGHLKRL